MAGGAVSHTLMQELSGAYVAAISNSAAERRWPKFVARSNPSLIVVTDRLTDWEDIKCAKLSRSGGVNYTMPR
jgi:nicotinic acid phosphoribosyltransferase